MRAQVQYDAGHGKFFATFVSAEGRLRKEGFFQANHLHWGHTEVMDLPADERWAYVKPLTEQLEQEQEALHRASKG